MIPEETAGTLRSIWGIELKAHGYTALVTYKALRSKQYLTDVLTKARVHYDTYANLDDLQTLVMNHIQPTTLLGGFSPRDGLDASDLSKWCREL